MTAAVAALAAALAASLTEPSSTAGTAGAAGSARATASGLEVSLDVDRCPLLPRDHMFQLVALELDARVVTPDRAGEQTARVAVACAGAEVHLEVSDRLTGKLLTRTMTLAGRDAQVSARLVAIAVAELVLTSWMELTLPRASAAPTAEGATAAPELLRAAQERAQRHFPRAAGTGYVLAVAQALGPFDGVGVAWGGGLRFGWTAGGAAADDGVATWRPGFDLELTAARNETSRGLGVVNVSMWSAALRVSLRRARGRAWFDVGAGGRAGVARLAGTPDDVTTTRGATLAGTWAGPIIYVGVGTRFSRLAVTAGVEGGTVLRPVSGLIDEGPPTSVAGRWLSGTLAIGWGG